jgi:hypothetical protein
MRVRILRTLFFLVADALCLVCYLGVGHEQWENFVNELDRADALDAAAWADKRNL